jgi:hypothetical protein
MKSGWGAVLVLAAVLDLRGTAHAIESYTFDYDPGCTISGVDPGGCFGGV